MQVIEKIQSLFAKKDSPNVLNIVLCPDSICYAYSQPSSAWQYNEMPLIEGSYIKTLASLSEGYGLEGKARLVLPPKLIQNVQVDKPNVPAEEMHSALKWLVQDLVSLAANDVVLDYYDAPKLMGGNDKINVVCAPLTELSNIVPTLTNDKISLTTISIEEFAFASLVPKQEDARMLICQQPNEEVLILVVKNGALFFHRRLRGYTKLAAKSPEELEMGIIDALSLEIQRSSDYFEHQLKQAPIKAIEVIVPIEHEAFLARKLAENSNIPVHLLKLPETEQEYRNFAVLIGANNLIIDQVVEGESENDEEVIH